MLVALCQVGGAVSGSASWHEAKAASTCRDKMDREAGYRRRPIVGTHGPHCASALADVIAEQDGVAAEQSLRGR